MELSDILNNLETLSKNDHVLKQSLSDLRTDLQKPNINVANRITSWINISYSRCTTKYPELDRLAHELCLFVANDQPIEALKVLYQTLGNLELAKLTNQFTPDKFLNRHYLLKRTKSRAEIIPLPKNWQKVINNADMKNLIKLWEEAHHEKQITQYGSLNTAQQEAFDFLDKAEGLSFHEAQELIETRRKRLSALMLDSVTPGLPATNAFWSAFEKIYQKPDVSVISMDMKTHPTLGIEPLSNDKALDELYQARKAINQKQYEDNANGLSQRIEDQEHLYQIENVLEEYHACKDDIRKFLANRKDMDKAHGYTADPFSPANLFCARLAWNLVDQTSLPSNPRQQFWNLLYPVFKKTWMGSTDSDWPNYGEAIFTGRGLVNYVKLSRMCQYRDVYMTVMEAGKPNDPELEKIMRSHPNYWKFTPKERSAIRQFNPDEAIFWLTHANEQNEFDPGIKINNIADFFRELKKVLDKYKKDIRLEEEMSEEGVNEIRPFLTYLWTSSIIPQLEAYQNQFDSSSNIYSKLTDLIMMRANLAPSKIRASSSRIESCFKINADKLNSIFPDTDDKPELVQYLESDACLIKPRSVITWQQGGSKNSDKRPTVELDTDIIKKSLQEINKSETLFDWIGQCYKKGMRLPIGPIIDKMKDLSQKMSVKDVFNFIYENIPKGANASTQSFFYDEDGADLTSTTFMSALLSKIFMNGIPADKLITPDDYVWAIKLHNDYEVNGKGQTIIAAVNFVKATFETNELSETDYLKFRPLIVSLLSDPDACANNDLIEILKTNHISIPTLTTHERRTLSILSLIDINNFENALNRLYLFSTDKMPSGKIQDQLSGMVDQFYRSYPDQYKKTLIWLKTLNKFPDLLKKQILNSSDPQFIGLSIIALMSTHVDNFEDELAKLLNINEGMFEHVMNYVLNITARREAFGRDSAAKLINQFADNITNKVLTIDGFFHMFNKMSSGKRETLLKHLDKFGMPPLDSLDNWCSVLSKCHPNDIDDFAEMFHFNDFLSSLNSQNKIHNLTIFISRLNHAQLEKLFGWGSKYRDLFRTISLEDAIKVITSFLTTGEGGDLLKIAFLFNARYTSKNHDDYFHQIMDAVDSLTDNQKNSILTGFFIYLFRNIYSTDHPLLATIQHNKDLKPLALKAFTLILKNDKLNTITSALGSLIKSGFINQKQKIIILKEIFERSEDDVMFFETLRSLIKDHLITPDEGDMFKSHYLDKYNNLNDFNLKIHYVDFEDMYDIFRLKPNWFDSPDTFLHFAQEFTDDATYKIDRVNKQAEQFKYEPPTSPIVIQYEREAQKNQIFNNAVSHDLARHILKTTADFPANGIVYFQEDIMKAIGQYCSTEDAHDLIERYLAVCLSSASATFTFTHYLDFISQFSSLFKWSKFINPEEVIDLFNILIYNPAYNFSTCTLSDFSSIVVKLGSFSGQFIDDKIDFLCGLIDNYHKASPNVMTTHHGFSDYIYHANDKSRVRLVNAIYPYCRSSLPDCNGLISLVEILENAHAENTLANSLFGDLMARFIKVYTLLIEEQVTGKIRHRSDLQTVSRIDLNRLDDWKNALAMINNPEDHPLMSQAWNLSCIEDQDQRFEAVYDACLKSSPLNVSKKSGRLLFSAFSEGESRSSMPESGVCNKNYPDGTRRAKVKSACLAKALDLTALNRNTPS